MPLQVYYPEMGEKVSPDVQIHASLCYGGRHYYLRTKLDLPTGRSVKLERINADGERNYRVTKLAFEKLKEEHEIGYRMLLD